MGRVIEFPGNDEHEGVRLHQMHIRHPALFDLATELGSADDWLHTAMQHLSVQAAGTGWDGGKVDVSRAAISLVLMKLEQLLFGGSEISVRPID